MNKAQTFGIGWIPSDKLGYILSEYAITIRGGYIVERGMEEQHAINASRTLNHASLFSGSYVPVFTYS